MTDQLIIPGNVFSLLHLIEFGARIAGDKPDADALARIEPTLEAAARGLLMAMPAIREVLALIEAHIVLGVPAEQAVDVAAAHVAAAPEIQDRQATET